MPHMFNKVSALWMVRTGNSSSAVCALEIAQLQPCSNCSFHDSYSLFGFTYFHVMHVLLMFSQTQGNPCRFIELFLSITPFFPIILPWKLHVHQSPKFWVLSPFRETIVLSGLPLSCNDTENASRQKIWTTVGLTLFVPLYPGSLSCTACCSVSEINCSHSLSSFLVVYYTRLTILPVTAIWLEAKLIM